jgi:chromosomal replication initiator protein
VSRVTIAALKEAAARYHRIQPDDISGPSREREISWPRQEVMYLARNLTEHSTTVIGKWLNRDHSTVVTGSRAVEKRLAEREPETVEAVSAIREMVL